LGETAQPRTVILLAAAAVSASLVGWRSALLTLGCLPILGLAAPPRLGTRVAVIVGGLLVVLVLLPYAPYAVAEVALRGCAASLALVVITARLPWPAAVAELAQMGLPRAGVAFLALLARHVEVLAESAAATVSVLKTRGAFARRANIPRAVAVLVSRLLVQAWLRADRVADALALRGFEGRLAPNAPWEPRRSEAPQYVILAATLAAALWELAR
jgi:energy-coupling factor transporter transmembrane protein EcfT